MKALLPEGKTRRWCDYIVGKHEQRDEVNKGF